MANTPTTASVASRMTDLRISTLTHFIETRGRFQIAESYEMMCEDIATVLRDYVRMRRLANAVKTVAIGKDSDYHKVTEIERLIAEAEKGTSK